MTIREAQRLRPGDRVYFVQDKALGTVSRFIGLRTGVVVKYDDGTTGYVDVRDMDGFERTSEFLPD